VELQTVWVVQEYEATPGHERQGRPDRLLSTTIFAGEAEERARLVADTMRVPGRRIVVYETFVNR
jgi:hypothetical protein